MGKTKKTKHGHRVVLLGFTIVEVLVAIVVLGILATITAIAYNGVQARAHDASVQSDIERMEALQTSYALKHNKAGKSYYSGNGPDNDLDFNPSEGNVISVAVNQTDYCIRGYNVNGTKNSMENALEKESSPGVCSALSALDSPPAPSVTVTAGGSGVLATVTPIECTTGTIQYGFQSRINDGEWSDFSNWGANQNVTQSASEGTKYGYRVQARCYVNSELISEPVLGLESTYTQPVNPPSSPSVGVTYSGGMITATVNPVTCSMPGATLQYAYDSRANDGSWAGFSAWSSNLTSTRSATQGYKYGYRVQARCYVNGSLYSVASAAGAEGTYIYPITFAPVPSVVANPVDWTTTNFSWSASGCPTGSSYRYQYDFFAGSYEAGWTPVNGTSATTASFTTSTYGITYTLKVRALCYSPYSTGPYGAEGSTSYYHAYPTVQALVVAGGGGGGSSTSDASGGGGGAGGVVYHSGKAVSSTSYWITVGGGGQCNSCNGGNSSFQDVVSYGGGGGGPTNEGGYNGGSGGGGAGAMDGSTNARGYATQTSTGGGTGYGNYGGKGQWRADGKAGGGGGGATQPGGSAYDGDAEGIGKMVGGRGYYSDITGVGQYYGGGGGGGSCCYFGVGGAGGGGNGAQNGRGANGSANTGGGGGGGGSAGGGYGGSGIVVIRYPTGSLGATGGSQYTSGAYQVHVFYGSGTFQVY